MRRCKYEVPIIPILRHVNAQRVPISQLAQKPVEAGDEGVHFGESTELCGNFPPSHL